MIDTESLLFWCQTDDIYKDMSENPLYFDTSDYAKDHFCTLRLTKRKLD